MSIQKSQFASMFNVKAVNNSDINVFLEKHFQTHAATFVKKLMGATAQTFSESPGPDWTFAETTMGNPFAYPENPPSGETLKIKTRFGFAEADMPKEVVGVITSALAILIMAENADELGISDDLIKSLIEHYYGLISAGQNMAIAAGCSDEYFHLTD
ncbi:hypothetical protein [Marinobacter sp. ELB17]|uniref:hypothetical protein n=1 Tax=Marinobacter sp. ELB17 TaxID=270374 RepID=UPI0000F39C62|nr:hypothetical protein [Marinobacter sp. ELB17]EAZ97231.1 hypothetical protein MELB17_10078 [Marinobacter sp. ELB17]